MVPVAVGVGVVDPGVTVPVDAAVSVDTVSVVVVFTSVVSEREHPRATSSAHSARVLIIIPAT
jgi:hypothetical protein